ncbi:YtzH-like family protein [Cytobacillus gottheilii]|uniref:YtzH-like family protein n=1 Tax=Cytobacillus gottheilii TaxID=859144 RepID=A0ABX8FA94_9BACI|nr:YtzH-like family protein [Cytobacillus gottheilii]QVY60728.1 YtzH-like family protein [Cytobacillus gottheilii]
MPLNQQDQFSLLKDILSNHQNDCCGSVAECEQLERLVKSLMVQTNSDRHIQPVLEEIYRYSQNGIAAPELDQHIESNQQELSQWVSEINQYS